jgi:hypothetical protein
MEYISEDKRIRVLDILAHIEKLNRLIAMHSTETKSSLMVKQYQHLRQQFLTELKSVLSDFQLTVDMATAA